MTKTIYLVHECGGMLCKAFASLSEATLYAEKLTKEKGYDHDIVFIEYNH